MYFQPKSMVTSNYICYVIAKTEKESCYTLLPKTVNNFNLSASYKRNEH
jgi:hypothetical protein